MHGRSVIILSLIVLMLVSFSSCKKSSNNTTEPETGTMTDSEGNTYKTVKIGDQWWMAENLKVTRYRNGLPIPMVNDINNSTTWNNQGASCLYDNNSRTPGLLYNWLAIEDTSNIAPLGWHVPSDAEWKILELTLGMNPADVDKTNWRGTDEGSKIKMTGSSYWTPFESLWNTNESGFSALAGGCRMFNNNWSVPYGLTYSGFWWTSSANNSSTAIYRHLNYKKDGVFRFYGEKTYGFSIRCIKD